MLALSLKTKKNLPKIGKRYDTLENPYESLMESPYILEEIKEELKTLYDKLNP